MPQTEQFQKLVIALRVAYWFIVGTIIAVIYALPDKHLSLASAQSQSMFYYLLLLVAGSEIVAMLAMDTLAYRAATGVGSIPASVNVPTPRSMPTVLFAFGISTAIYALLFRFMGGSVSRSLSFLVFTFIAYIIFSIATVRYSALISRDQGSL